MTNIYNPKPFPPYTSRETCVIARIHAPRATPESRLIRARKIAWHIVNIVVGTLTAALWLTFFYLALALDYFWDLQ